MRIHPHNGLLSSCFGFRLVKAPGGENGLQDDSELLSRDSGRSLYVPDCAGRVHSLTMINRN